MNWDTHPRRTALIKRQPIEIELDKKKVEAIRARGHEQHPWPPSPTATRTEGPTKQ